MIWYLLIGMFLTGWTLLLLISAEHARRLHAVEAKRQQALVEAKTRQEKENRVPVVG
jgi:hypothetical protein